MLFFFFCFRGNNHNSSDLCKKYSEISLYKYSLQNKHIYTYLCTCRLFTSIDQKISASSDRVPINCNEEEVKPKLQSEKEVCLFFHRGCTLFCFVFLTKIAPFFLRVWLFSVLWYDMMGCCDTSWQGDKVLCLRTVHCTEQALQWRLARDESQRFFKHVLPHGAWSVPSEFRVLPVLYVFSFFYDHNNFYIDLKIV